MRGFTLLEALIVIALFIATIFALTHFYAVFNRYYTFQNVSAKNATDTGRAIAEIENAILPASSVLSSRTFTTGTYATGANVLVLEIPSVSSSGSIVSATYDYVAFYVSSGTLYRRLEANGASSRVTGTTQLVSGVTALTFSYDSGDYANVTRINTDLTTQAVHRGGTVTTRLTSEAYLRN